MIKAKEAGNGAVFSVRVKAGAGSFSIASGEDGITIRTKSPAENNKANLEIVKELSKLFGREVRIVRGQKSKKKEILVAGASPNEIEALLAKR